MAHMEKQIHLVGTGGNAERESHCSQVEYTSAYQVRQNIVTGSGETQDPSVEKRETRSQSRMGVEKTPAVKEALVMVERMALTRAATTSRTPDRKRPRRDGSTESVDSVTARHGEDKWADASSDAYLERPSSSLAHAANTGRCDDGVEVDAEMERTTLLSRPLELPVTGSDPKRPRRDDSLESGSRAISDCDTDASVASTSSKSRGRRRQTHGRYVGVSRQQELLKELNMETEQLLSQEEQLRLKEQREEARKAREARAAVRELMRSGKRPLDPDSIKERIEGNLLDILDVAQRSKNLKGDWVKRLKDAVEFVQDDVYVLAARTTEEETCRLQAENKRLSEEVEDLKKNMAALRKQIAPELNLFEDFQRTILLSVGNMIDAKLAGNRESLPPEKVIRPPLAADRKRVEAEAAKTLVNKVPAVRAPKPKQAAKSAQVTTPTATDAGAVPVVVVSAATQETAADEKWTTVVKRKAKNKATRAAAASASTAASAKTPAQAKRRRKRGHRRGKRRRSGRNVSSVLISLDPEAEKRGVSYANVMAKARTQFNVADVGIDVAVSSIRLRKAATGARIVELPKNVSQDKANLLAEKLKGLLGEDARVTVPIKCAELRISYLDDSVTKEDVLAAVAEQGRCPPSSVKVGNIRDGPGGNGTTLVQCPLDAAQALGKAGRLLVGWMAARVVLLSARPMKCYRCCEVGHTRARCTSETDRSGCCYRCGQPGHKANACSAKQNCVICAAAGRKSNHEMGGRGCAPLTSKKKNQTKKAGGAPVAPVVDQGKPCEEAMLVE